jgi:hypothetical protein
MTIMDHAEAVRLQAAEKYVLGELSQQLRDEYEEHYFDCQDCAAELKATVAFVDSARGILRAEKPAEVETENVAARTAPWMAWLRPAFAVPVFALLLLVIGYQNFVSIPRLQRNAVSSGQAADLVSLIGANSRAEGARSYQLHRDKPAILEVDIPTTAGFAGYACRLQDGWGRVAYEQRVSAAEAKQTIHLIVPAGLLHAGNYTLTVLGEQTGGQGSPAEVEQLVFHVEFVP